MATLVLIPGLVSDSIVWAPLAEAVAQHMAVHAADVSRTSSISTMAESILAATDGDLIAVGHSMGGRVAMEMARIAPDRMRGLVLANTGHHPKRDGKDPGLLPQLREVAAGQDGQQPDGTRSDEPR